jgi:hypothetical protein
MTQGRFFAVLILCSTISAPAVSQELGTLQSFGASGRLISTGITDLYILSKQSYASEDSGGFQGQLRIVKKYEGGGYEELIRDYFVRCVGIDMPEGGREVMISEPGKDFADAQTVSITRPEKFPGAVRKGVYNLYWAACHSTFQKYK